MSLVFPLPLHKRDKNLCRFVSEDLQTSTADKERSMSDKIKLL